MRRESLFHGSDRASKECQARFGVATRGCVGQRSHRRCRRPWGVTSLLLVWIVAGSGVVTAQEGSTATGSTTPAFAIPSSDLVFGVTAIFDVESDRVDRFALDAESAGGGRETEGVRSHGTGRLAKEACRLRRLGESESSEGRHGDEAIDPRFVHFEAREGSLVIIDPTPHTQEGRIGLVFTLDRAGALLSSTGRRIIVHPYRIEEDPSGGEHMTILDMSSGPFEGVIPIRDDGVSFDVTVCEDRMGNFADDELIDDIWAAVAQDPDALDGMYEVLYGLYGPTAAGCYICNGVLICATSISGCGGLWL